MFFVTVFTSFYTDMDTLNWMDWRVCPLLFSSVLYGNTPEGWDANDAIPIWKFDHLMNEYCCSRERIYVRKRVWPLFSFSCLKLSLLSVDSFNSKHEGGQVFALTTISL